MLDNGMAVWMSKMDLSTVYSSLLIYGSHDNDWNAQISQDSFYINQVQIIVIFSILSTSNFIYCILPKTGLKEKSTGLTHFFLGMEPGFSKLNYERGIQNKR